MIHGHGDDLHDYPERIRANFSSNCWPGVDPAALHAHLCRRMDAIHAYPEPDARSLTEKLAEAHGLSPDHFCVTSGATEAIYRVARARAGAVSTIVVPTFAEYEDACRAAGHTLRFVNELSGTGEDTDLLWLCEPNNPTGRVRGPGPILDRLAARSGTLAVLDRSYADFTDRPTLDLREAVRHENLITIGSMTKRHAIPGLRLGYLAAHPARISELRAGQMPWAVGALAVEAGLFLAGAPPGGVPLADLLAETGRLQAALTAIGGLDVLPSDTPFFLCRLADGSAAELKRYLVEKHGILIRDASNFRGLDGRYFRLCTQLPEQNDLLVEGIRQWMSTR